MSRELILSPLAIALDGTLLVNLAHVVDRARLDELLEAARNEPGGVFVAILPTRPELKAILRLLDDAGAEAVAKLVGARQRRQRTTNRKRRSNAP